MTSRFSFVVCTLVVFAALACVPDSSVLDTSTTYDLPAPAVATTPDTSVVTATAPPATAPPTNAPAAGRLLAPGWTIVGTGDRVGGLMFGTGEELIIWGGLPAANLFDDPPALFSGVAWNHEAGTTRLLTKPPIELCPGSWGAAWTGVELVVWLRPFADPRCEVGGVAAYDPSTDAWRVIDAPEFVNAGAGAVWTGTEVLAWRQGLALDPSNGTVRTLEPLALNEGRTSSRIQAHWTGNELLVMGGNQLRRYQPETDTWTHLASPPIGVIAQASAWTGSHLLAVNYEMEAALFDPTTEEWTRIESMPLRFWETIPQTFSSEGLTMVGMGSAMAALDGDTWVAVPDPVMEWPEGIPYGARVIADGWLYQVGEYVLRRKAPSVIGEGVQTEPAIPMQTMLFATPESWTARLLPGGSSGRHSYRLDASDGRFCEIDAVHGGEPPPTSDVADMIRSWDGASITVGVDASQSLAVVDDSDRSSDWVEIRCNSPEAAQFMASHVWVSERE